MYDTLCEHASDITLVEPEDRAELRREVVKAIQTKNVEPLIAMFDNLDQCNVDDHWWNGQPNIYKKCLALLRIDLETLLDGTSDANNLRD